MSDDPAERITSAEEGATRPSLRERRQERRRFPRFPFNADVEVVEVQSGTRIKGRVTDLSLGGCYVDTLSPFLVSTAVHIRIARGAQSFEAQAKVTYMKFGVGMGLAFVAAQVEQKQVLGNWIAELGGKLPTELPRSAGDVTKDKGSGEIPNVIAALILALTRKGVLTEAEGQEMLRKLRR
jgi:PilZ domain